MICVVGLGYVGLPLAVAFGKKEKVIGFDISVEKISNLNKGIDETGEVPPDELAAADIEFSSDPKIISQADFVIVAVPTPINEQHEPDMSFVLGATEIVASNMKKGSTIVYESTVYPGATEEDCVPILENRSGLVYKKDFFVGYSPERINPGDKSHTVDKIVKVVSGCDQKTLDLVADTYAKVVDAGIHKASSIKVAEAAKVIENIQRDLNIALMNELSLIFGKMGINTCEVINAAATKWNFHKFYPGLVGGHCIGVDPYYLTYKAETLGHRAKIILAGREINEYMAVHVAGLALAEISKGPVLVLGLTFKENVRDHRNSKAVDVISSLKKRGIEVHAIDPLLKPEIIQGMGAKPGSMSNKYSCVIMLVPHEQFKKITLQELRQTMDRPVLIDVRSFYDRTQAENMGFVYKSL